MEIRTIYTPIDELYETHTEEDCWCFPGTFRDMTIHRSLDMIDRTGPEGKFITGFARVWPKN